MKSSLSESTTLDDPSGPYMLIVFDKQNIVSNGSSEARDKNTSEYVV